MLNNMLKVAEHLISITAHILGEDPGLQVAIKKVS